MAKPRQIDVPLGPAPRALDLEPRVAALDRLIHGRRRIDGTAVGPAACRPDGSGPRLLRGLRRTAPRGSLSSRGLYPIPWRAPSGRRRSAGSGDASVPCRHWVPMRAAAPATTRKKASNHADRCVACKCCRVISDRRPSRRPEGRTTGRHRPSGSQRSWRSGCRRPAARGGRTACIPGQVFRRKRRRRGVPEERLPVCGGVGWTDGRRRRGVFADERGVGQLLDLFHGRKAPTGRSFGHDPEYRT
jgi:hypothetical protein